MADDKSLAEASSLPDGNDDEPSTARDSEHDDSQTHPLHHKWTLTFDNPSQKQSVSKYGHGLRPVYSFDTVEDFWSMYNNIKTPSQLLPSATYYLFRADIEPKWEDPQNVNGGCWTVQVPKAHNGKQQLDTWWLNGILACIGEEFTAEDEVCGITVNIRPGRDRLELWTKTASDEALQTKVGKELKLLLDLPDTMRVGFGVFADRIQSGKGKDRYTV